MVLLVNTVDGDNFLNSRIKGEIKVGSEIDYWRSTCSLMLARMHNVQKIGHHVHKVP